jgi:SAM-dependent methyltransferase
MHPVLAGIPFIRRPFFRLERAREELARVTEARDAAIRERDALMTRLDAIISEGAQADSRDARPAVTPDAGRHRVCVFCGNQVDAWVPFHIRAWDMSDFLLRLETVGSNVERFLCPHCSSSDRERHLRLFLERLGILEATRGGSVLHMAPEVRLGEYVRSFGCARYVMGDLAPTSEAVQRIDLHDMPFPDETFDLVICNHVLEHVRDAAASLREIHRVLKPGGRAICQTPFARRLAKTFEDALLQSPEDRLFFFGQDDHVRLFGLDIEQWILDAGFRGRLVAHSEILPDVDPERLGLNEHEPFFDFVRVG